MSQPPGVSPPSHTSYVAVHTSVALAGASFLPRSQQAESGFPQMLSEAVATFGLLSVI
jgi:hypothetical protein